MSGGLVPGPRVVGQQPLHQQQAVQVQPHVQTLALRQGQALAPHPSQLQPAVSQAFPVRAVASQPALGQLNCVSPQALPSRLETGQSGIAQRRLVTVVGADAQCQAAPSAGSGRPSTQQVRFADEVKPSNPRAACSKRQQVQPPSFSDHAAIHQAAPQAHQRSASPARGGTLAKSALRRTAYANGSNASAAPAASGSSCTALACPSRSREQGPSTMGPAREQRGAPPPVREERPPPEPELLVVRMLYLSRVPAGGWLQGPAEYLLSLHVGEDARNDPPPVPGIYCTKPVPAGPPQAVAPEETVLRQQIAKAIDGMQAQNGDDGQALRGGDASGQYLECRFKVRLAVRLSEAGPGPAAGGPIYFRVDAWSMTPGLFNGSPKPQLFARAFVPFDEAKYHRRACTWPMIDAAGKDVAYLTCEFSFARIPSPVQGLTATDVTGGEVRLAWQAPVNEDKVVPVKGYKVEAQFLGRGRQRGNVMPREAIWHPIGEVERGTGLGMLAQNLKPDSRYLFRVCAVNEVGVGEPEDLEATTAPCAPAGCGQLRLAGCNGSILAVEWEGPSYDGGVDIVAYRIWVRPFTASDADPSAWLEVGHAKHNSNGVQRADIHTEDFDSSVGRYLCRVAAINTAGETGPPTPDAVCLTLPNPCCLSKPNRGRAALADISPFGGDLWPPAGGADLLTMTINEPGKKSVTVPLLQEFMHVPDLAVGLMGGPMGQGSHDLMEPMASHGGASVPQDLSRELALPENLDATYQNWSLPFDLESKPWNRSDAFSSQGRYSFEDAVRADAMLGALVPVSRSSRHDTASFDEPDHRTQSRRHQSHSQSPPRLQEALMQQDVVSRMLEEKRALLESSKRPQIVKQVGIPCSCPHVFR
eukprot:TRINITY_DN13766_c0_g1_i3.p1 TRINITY_DN13766_c0_g1~~TRINITY_DN13766_c0_g1_i3.p1  ORF type:complete len:882 (+),score=126.71 TRINITY_DN13766_c0_g1_i3:36-2648(+)